MTLANKTDQCCETLTTEGSWELSTQKPWTCWHVPMLAKIFKVTEDGKFKSSLLWPLGPIFKDILRPQRHQAFRTYGVRQPQLKKIFCKRQSKGIWGSDFELQVLILQVYAGT